MKQSVSILLLLSVLLSLSGCSNTIPNELPAYEPTIPQSMSRQLIPVCIRTQYNEPTGSVLGGLYYVYDSFLYGYEKRRLHQWDTKLPTSITDIVEIPNRRGSFLLLTEDGDLYLWACDFYANFDYMIKQMCESRIFSINVQALEKIPREGEHEFLIPLANDIASISKTGAIISKAGDFFLYSGYWYSLDNEENYLTVDRSYDIAHIHADDSGFVYIVEQSGNLFQFSEDDLSVSSDSQKKTDYIVLTDVINIQGISEWALGALTKHGDLYVYITEPGMEDEVGGENWYVPREWLSDTWVKVADGVTSFRSGISENCPAVILFTDSNNTLWALGDNQYGQLGNKKYTRFSDWIYDDNTYWTRELVDEQGSTIPVKVLEKVDTYDTDGTSCVAVTIDGEMYCWGNNANFALTTRIHDVRILEPMLIDFKQEN